MTFFGVDMAVVSSSLAPCRGPAQKKIARNNVRVNLEYSSGFILIGRSGFILIFYFPRK
jgi:hypothetical protein